MAGTTMIGIVRLRGITTTIGIIIAIITGIDALMMRRLFARG